MDRKAVTGIMLTLLLIGTLCLVFDVGFVGVSGTAYRADGSVEHASTSSTKGSSLLLNGGFENWSGTPLLPDGWFIVTIFPIYNTSAIHKSTIAHSGSFSLRLGGETTSEAGWNLGVVMAQDVPVRMGVSYLLTYYAFGRNPWGDLAGGISVDWLNFSRDVIGPAIRRVALPAGGVSSYTYFAGASGPPPSDTFYARIYVEKKSWGFINFDDVTFQESEVYPWPMFHKNKYRDGYTLDPGPITNATVWKQKIGLTVTSSPAVANNRVFVASTNGRYIDGVGWIYWGEIHCLHEVTGTSLWSATLAGINEYSSPAVADGMVFIGSHAQVPNPSGYMQAFNATTGASIWNYTINNGWITSSPAVGSGSVFFGSDNGKLYRLDEFTGNLIWTYQTGGAIRSSPAVDAEGLWQGIIVGSQDGSVYALNWTRSPTPLWRFNTLGPVDSTPALCSHLVSIFPLVIWEVVLVGSCDGNVYMINRTNCVLLANYSIGSAVRSSPAIELAPPFRCVDRVFVGADDGKVYALRVWNYSCPALSLVWSRSTSAAVMSSPALSRTLINYPGPPDYMLVQVGSDDGKVYSWDYYGNPTWSFQTGGPVQSSPAVDKGWLFVGSGDGNVYAFGTIKNIDGVAVWQHVVFDCPSPWKIWYSIWDDSAKDWWTPTGAKAAPVYYDPEPWHDEHNEMDPNIAFDRNNNSICVWARNVTDGFNLSPNVYDIYYSKLPNLWNDPFGWTPRAPIASIEGNDIDPAIAFDNNGWAIAIWVHENKTGERVIYYSLWNGTDWIGAPPSYGGVPGPLVPISTGRWPLNASLPEITFTSKPTAPSAYTPNKAVAIWTDWNRTARQSRIYYAIWNGTAWTDVMGATSVAEIPGQLCEADWDGIPATYRNGISSDSLGNVTVVWAATNYSAPQRKPILYARWDGYSWTPANVIHATEGMMPTIAFNATLDAHMAYTNLHVDLPSEHYNIWYNQYDSVRMSWGPTPPYPKKAADSGGFDLRPAIAFMPSNSSIIVWWSNVSTYYPSEIFFSLFNPITRTYGPARSIVPYPGLSKDDINPSIASRTGSPTMPPAFVHDTAVTSIKPSKTVVGQGYSMRINVTVANQGDHTETFRVTVYANATSIVSHTVTLTSGNSTTITFTWNTTGFPYGNYTITATATQVPGETDTRDNTYPDGWILVTIVGDVNGDRRVIGLDRIIVGIYLWTMAGQPGFNPNADVNGDGRVTGLDRILVGIHLWESWS